MRYFQAWFEPGDDKSQPAIGDKENSQDLLYRGSNSSASSSNSSAASPASSSSSGESRFYFGALAEPSADYISLGGGAVVPMHMKEAALKKRLKKQLAPEQGALDIAKKGGQVYAIRPGGISKKKNSGFSGREKSGKDKKLEEGEEGKKQGEEKEEQEQQQEEELKRRDPPGHSDANFQSMISNMFNKRSKKFEAILYIQTELCSQTLEGWLSARGAARRPVDRVENLIKFRQLIEGLRDVHAAKIIHRDIKPSNLFISKGVIKIGGEKGFSQNLPEHPTKPK